jgi:hypothetical protein
MKKVAIFVEGQTELHFVHRLVTEIAGHGAVRVALWLHRGGALHEIRVEGAPEETAEVFVMLVNCGGDEGVKSFILERRESLAAKDFKMIIGLRDLFPITPEKRERFEAGLTSGLDFPGQTIRIFLAVAEVEAWFLNESTHYEKVDPALTLGRIRAETGFDPESPSIETDVPHPATVLKNIYALVGKRYRKREAETHSLISHLDFDEIYTTVRDNSTSLDAFISCLESAIWPPNVEAAGAAGSSAH